MSDQLLDNIMRGEVFAAAYQRSPQLLDERYNCNNDLMKSLRANDAVLNHFNGKIDASVYDHLDLFLDPKIPVLLTPSEKLRKMPKTHISAMEHDVLRDEEILFFEAAKKAGAKVELTLWEGAMHIEQSFSNMWLDKSPMPQSDVWIKQYIDKIKELALQ